MIKENVSEAVRRECSRNVSRAKQHVPIWAWPNRSYLFICMQFLVVGVHLFIFFNVFIKY